jgi:hypothetical protein
MADGIKMSKDQKHKASETAQDALPNEAVDEAKRAIVFGTGYQRPPKDKRFKKGQSGNPAGRPKRPDVGLGNSRSATTLALREGERLIGVREGDKVQQLAGIEAAFRAQYASGLRGNAYSLKHIIERYAWAERERRQQRTNEIEIWEVHVAEQRRAIADAEAKGEPPLILLPHPDDVVIDYEKGVRFIGPVNEEGVAHLNETLRVRDVLLMQDALDQRMGNRDCDDPLDKHGSALGFAFLLNQTVPDRYKLSDVQILIRLSRYEGMAKRTLLKEVYGAWRAIGGRPHRGRTFPPLRFAKQAIEQINDLLETHTTDESSRAG